MVGTAALGVKQGVGKQEIYTDPTDPYCCPLLLDGDFAIVTGSFVDGHIGNHDITI
jgi:hypothetical protein